VLRSTTSERSAEATCFHTEEDRMELKKDKRIVIGQRGHVWVGDIEHESSDRVVIANASAVRRWGTTKGLGQLAAEGPTKATVLDPCGTVRIHPLAIVGQIDCNAEAWRERR
jgi:hypothetical protein